MLQQHLLQIEEWLSTWKIKVNADKCKHVILRKGIIPPILLNKVTVPQTTRRFKTHVEAPYTSQTRSNSHKKKRRVLTYQ